MLDHFLHIHNAIVWVKGNKWIGDQSVVTEASEVRGGVELWLFNGEHLVGFFLCCRGIGWQDLFMSGIDFTELLVHGISCTVQVE